ncbi:HU family DNA-binding protein [Oceanivirga miroungae]|uniref:Histone family protein DNA-binding protein n=1 Tax=Oceanivirga miroungae TaxID=1130046 RepID=A0A6I8MDY1_9FUSO|nr:HU family DNA-binding protein [Oceanivirga miroungae]VWL85654.1 histone family protein DNA-binding protein [Oceanivirga miroungae]
MSKKEFVEGFALKSGESKKRSEELVNAFLQLVEESLVEGKDVQFVGWGSFTTKEKEARKGRNPRTGEDIEIPSKRVIKFKVGKKLADLVASK